MNKLFSFMRESSVARFLLPLGLILIIFGGIMFVINSKNQDYIKIEATVIDVKEEQETTTDEDGENTTNTIYNVTVNYTVDGQEYTQTLDNVSKHKVGDKMDIYYNPKDPNQITQTKSLILPIALIVAGFAALIGGIVSLVNAVKRHKKMKEQERNWANE